MTIRLPYVCAPCQVRLGISSSLQPFSSGSRTKPLRQHPSATQRRTKTTLPSQPVRTRFAPSPTGSLHLGSLRTALFNYLLARATKGQFLLRLEDTDAKRTVPGAEESLYHDLQWAGLQWDEGPLIGGEHGPYRQSERTGLYREHAHQLLSNGHAYRCFCTQERLHELGQRRQALGLPTDYDRTCASVSREESDDRAHAGEKHTIRLRSPPSYPQVTDLVYGRLGKGDTQAITHKHGEIAYEDPVLLKSDGTPTYHLANVVDDHHMAITHVVRATEWLPSTPKHLALYDAFGWTTPAYAHVGLLVDAGGRKLSKRAMDTGVSSLREQGWLPETLLNFAALLGCSYERKSDVMSLDELVENFKMKFTKGNTIVTEEKLHYLQRHHAARIFQQYADDSGIKTTDHLTHSLAEPDLSFSHYMPGGDWQPSAKAMIQAVASAAAAHDGVPATAGKDRLAVFNRTLFEQSAAVLAHDARNYTLPSPFVERNIYLLAPLPAEAQLTALRTLLDTALPGIELASLLVAMLQGFLRTLEKRTPISAQLDPYDNLIKSYALVLREVEKRLDEKTAYSLWCRILRAVFVAGNRGPGLGATMEVLGLAECKRRVGMGAEQAQQLLNEYVGDGGKTWSEVDEKVKEARGKVA